MNTSVTLRTSASDRWKRPGSQDPGANVFGVLDRGAPSDLISSPPQEVLVAVHRLLQGQRGLLEPHPVRLHADALLQALDRLRALAVRARVLPRRLPVHDAVALRLRLVRLPRDLAVLVRRIDLDLQSLPGVLPGAAVDSHPEPVLHIAHRVRAEPSVLDDVPCPGLRDRVAVDDVA